MLVEGPLRSEFILSYGLLIRNHVPPEPGHVETIVGRVAIFAGNPSNLRDVAALRA
jgi:hypothetical protein